MGAGAGAHLGDRRGFVDRFTSQWSLLGSGRWRVDDVYVDPWKVI